MQGKRGQPGLSLPLICATVDAVQGRSSMGTGARFIAGGRHEAVRVNSRGARDLISAYPQTAVRLCGTFRRE
jgi:hypothetical protein